MYEECQNAGDTGTHGISQHGLGMAAIRASAGRYENVLWVGEMDDVRSGDTIGLQERDSLSMINRQQCALRVRDATSNTLLRGCSDRALLQHTCLFMALMDDVELRLLAARTRFSPRCFLASVRARPDPLR